MNRIETITIKGESWQLLPERAVFWKSKEMLILCDLHLGKAGHFRKSGIPAPGRINTKNLDRLTYLIDQLIPKTVLILGDLFHSSANREWFEFEEWLQKYNETDFILVTGNHDQLHHSFYETANFKLCDSLKSGPFLFIHDADAAKNQNGVLVPVGGHIHPAVKLKGKGRQTLRFPAYIISDKRILIPAFGEFTGLHTVQLNETDKAYAVVNEDVIPINP